MMGGKSESVVMAKLPNKEKKGRKMEKIKGEA